MLYNLVLILVVGHCFSTVSLDFVGMESLQLDLRNELNIITEDVTKKFLEENTFHGHVFHTGIGNREELKVTSFIRNYGFKFGYDVKKWQALTTKEKIYFLGLTSKHYLILISSSLNSHLNNTTDGSQHIIELPLNVIANAACMFERWNSDNKSMEVLIVIATNSSTSDIIWYKVNMNKAVKFWSWPRYKAVSSMTLLATGKLSHLIIISADEEGSFTTADVYNIMLNKHPPYFSLLQSLPLDESSSSVEVSIIGKNAYLFIPQTNLGSVLVFKYDLSVDNYDYFQRNINISSPSVTEVHSFTTASQSFVAVNGKSPNIYRIKYSGAFVTNMESDFSEVEDFLIIPIHSYRSEVIIFANQNNFTRLLVWKGSIKGFSEDVLPQCNEGQCLDGTFSGAVTFKINNLPSVLLPRRSNYSVLYHIITSLSEVKDPVLTEIFKLKEKRTFIQEFWDRQNNIRKEIKDSLKYVIKANETNKISAVWTVNSIETPLLVQSGRVDSKSDVKNSSSLFSDPENADLNSLKESIQNVTNTISKLKSDIERVKNRDWNFTNYEGKLLVKGTVEINQLSLQELNDMDVDEILNNSLRWDRPKNITGEKIIPSLNANQIIFNQINDLYASNLSYKSSPVVLSGNVLFKEKIKVQEFIKLPPQGLVNQMNISKACKLNEICSVNLKLKNVTVYNNMFATEANSQTLDKSYTSQELSESVKVFAGSNLSVVAINGRNLSDILSNVVYLDKDTYLPHITTVKGTVFTQDRIQLRNLITNQTDSAPQFKDAEERYSEIFKPKWSKKPDKMASLYNSAAATKNQTVNIHPLHNDELLEADVIFTNVEVDGVVSSFENINSGGWADIMADVVLKNEVNTEVCGTKIFKNTLQIKKDFYLKGLLNNVNISQVLTSDTEQILFDTRTFFGDITLKNVTLYGDWDGVDINKLDGESVKLYNDENLTSVKLTFEETNNIFTNDLTIIDSLNNISVEEVISYEKIKHGLELNTIKGINLTIMDCLTFSGNISNWDIKELDKSRISCSQDQNVTGIFTINELTVINELSADKINSINTSDLNYALENDYLKFNYSDILISDLYVSGNIHTTQGIAGYNLSAIAKDAILLTGNSNIKGDLVFEDLLTCNQLDVYVNVGGLNWTDFTKDVVYRHEKHVVLEGEKTFDLGFHVIEDLEVEEINSHRVDHILTTSTEQVIEGNLNILGDLIVDDVANIMGTLNERNISELASKCYIPEDSNEIQCTGNTSFKKAVYIKDLYLGKHVNKINFSEFIQSIVYKNTSFSVEGHKYFLTNVTLSDLNLLILNHQDLKTFLEDIVVMNPETEIFQHITFSNDVNVMNLVNVNYDIKSPTINSYNLSNWVENVVYLDKNMTVSGFKHFTAVNSRGDIMTKWYDDLDMMSNNIVLLNKEQSLKGSLKFSNISVLSDVPVGQKVNNVRLYQLFENTLMTEWDQVIKSNIRFLEDIVIEGNLTTLGNINERDLKKIITLHSNQSLSGKYMFECLDLKDANTSDIISGINISDWRKKAVLVDTDQVIHGPLFIDGEVKFTQPVINLLNLGETNLQELKEMIQIKVSDVETEMQKNLTSLCKETNELIEIASHQDMSILYFEDAQEIEISSESYNHHYFKTNGEDFLLISKHNCSCYFYKWSPDISLFSLVLQNTMSFFTHWFPIRHDNVSYIVSLSKLNNECLYEGINLWLLTNNTLQFIMKLEMNAEDLVVINSLTAVFYTLESTSVKKWSLSDDKNSMLTVNLEQEWIEKTNNTIKFMNSNAGLGLFVINGYQITPLLPDYSLPQNLLDSFNREIAMSKTSHHFISVTFWEDSEIERRSDFVKIYKPNGILYDKLLTRRPSQLQWFSLKDQAWLAFIENSTTLQIYQHQDVFRGFQLKLSIDVNSSKLLSTSLLKRDRFNEHPYLMLFSNSSMRLISSKVLGDPYVGSKLFCNYSKSLHWVGR